MLLRHGGNSWNFSHSCLNSVSVAFPDLLLSSICLLQFTVLLPDLSALFYESLLQLTLLLWPLRLCPFPKGTLNPTSQASVIVTNVDVGVGRGTLRCVEGWANGHLLFSTGASTQHPVITQAGKESEKEWMCVYVQLSHFVVEQTLSQPCKSTTRQQNFRK